MTVFGWDMSHFDAPSVGTALSEGISFITHKAGGDTRYGDPELGAWWQTVKDTDPTEVLLGTYWIPRPDLYPNATGRADDWLDMLDLECPGWREREHMLQVDAELWNGNIASRPDRNHLLALGGRLVSRMPKLRPIVYASAGQYGNSLMGLPWPLWNARYPSNVALGFKQVYALLGGDNGSGWVIYSGQMPAVWQYSSKATIGGQTTCDANAFRGSLNDLKALVAPGWSDDMPTAKEIVDELMTRHVIGNGTDFGTFNGIQATLMARTNLMANTQLPGLTLAVSADNLDEIEVAASVLAGLTPELLGAAIASSGLTPQAIADAIPAHLAEQLADTLAQRLGRPVQG
jgi:hypothetical protein